MRYLGAQAHGVRLPIISKGDDLSSIVVESVLDATNSMDYKLKNTDVIGITEAIVAKSQGNYATTDDIACDIRAKFPSGIVGLVFPIFSRNRFLNILKGISKGADKVYLLLQHPSDEVGNPIMDINILDDVEDQIKGLTTAQEFRKIVGEFNHPFTNIDYIKLYESVAPNIEVYLSSDARDILKLTKNVLVGEIHSRFRTKERLIKAGAENIYTLSDILSESINGSGYNTYYGVLGSNISTENTLKLFPRDSQQFLEKTRDLFFEKTGIRPQLLVYGDGAFKDPSCGIWELADPVVSPAYTEMLTGTPNEIKLKFVAENVFSGLDASEKQIAITKLIEDKATKNDFNDGTTPRKYADLIGSLCDLMSGSGDKGTPVVLISGYFDDYSTL